MMDTEKYNKLKENLIEQWVSTLAVSFGGLDFWQLSKPWKEKVYRQVAKMIVDEIEYMAQIVREEKNT